MQIPLPRLATALRVLGLLWLVGWALYVALWGEGLSFSIGHIAITLGTLFIPTVLAFAVAWGLDRHDGAGRGSD